MDMTCIPFSGEAPAVSGMLMPGMDRISCAPASCGMDMPCIEDCPDISMPCIAPDGWRGARGVLD